MASEKEQPQLDLEAVMATMGEDEWHNVRILEHYAESHISYSLVGVKVADGKTYYYQAETARFIMLNI
jgi:hypothetical protein